MEKNDTALYSALVFFLLLLAATFIVYMIIRYYKNTQIAKEKATTPIYSALITETTTGKTQPPVVVKSGSQTFKLSRPDIKEIPIKSGEKSGTAGISLHIMNLTSEKDIKIVPTGFITLDTGIFKTDILPPASVTLWVLGVDNKFRRLK